MNELWKAIAAALSKYTKITATMGVTSTPSTVLFARLPDDGKRKTAVYFRESFSQDLADVDQADGCPNDDDVVFFVHNEDQIKCAKTAVVLRDAVRSGALEISGSAVYCNAVMFEGMGQVKKDDEIGTYVCEVKVRIIWCSA